MLRRPRARLLFLVLFSALAGCASTTDATATSSDDGVLPTSLTVPPAAFLGSVPCSNEAGAVHSYVATVIDVTGDVDCTESLSAAGCSPVPFSQPTPCSDSVVFRYIVPGHQYQAIIDGYDGFASALTPLAGRSSGSRTMVCSGSEADCSNSQKSIKTGDVVLPRWTASCKGHVAVEQDNDVSFTGTDCGRFSASGGSDRP